MKIFLCIYGLISFSLIQGDFLTDDLSLENHVAPRIVNHNPYLNDFNRNPVLQNLNPIYDFPIIYYYPKPVPRPDAIVLIRKKTNSYTPFDPRVEIDAFKPNPRIARSVWNDFDVKRIARKGESDSREFRNRTGNVVRIQTYKNHSPGSRSAKKVEVVALEVSESVTQINTQASESPEVEGFAEIHVDEKEEQSMSELAQETHAQLHESPNSSNKNDQIAQENQQFTFVPEKLSESECLKRLESLESVQPCAKTPDFVDSFYVNAGSSLNEEDYPFFPSQTSRKSPEWEKTPSQTQQLYQPMYEKEKNMVNSYESHRQDYDTASTNPDELPQHSIYPSLSDSIAYGHHSTYESHQEDSDSFEPPVKSESDAANPGYNENAHVLNSNHHLGSFDYSDFQPLEQPELDISHENDRINCLITTLTGETVTTLPPHSSEASPYSTQSSGVRAGDQHPENRNILPTYEELEIFEQAILKLEAELPSPNFETEHFLLYDVSTATDSSTSAPFASYVTDFPYMGFNIPEPQYYTDSKLPEQPYIY